ncbi:MAG: efflux RND transporter permease subunit [Candidatus Obscuribacterales bacterium]|nr:efflux RND transporter permease subunit [Candidatus Obscuribacterales bacterium]
MWIVQLALRRPYTFVVMAIFILIMGIVSIRRMPVDIFPDINIPVISVIWTYNGMSAEEFEHRLTMYSEFSLSANVKDLKNMESQTLDGVGVIKLYFHPGANVESAMAQATAVSQAILRRMPPGVQPPIILRYSASSVPIIQLSLSSKNLSESQLYDYGIFRIRQALAVVQGTTLPAPYGGKVRQIMIDVDPQALQAKGLSPRDLNDAINAQNLALPSGRAKIGDIDYRVLLNNTPEVISTIGDIPVKTINGKVVFIRDVATVRDGFAVQQNMVRTEGSRSVLVTILKNGAVSTLDIVKQIKELVPTLQAAAPPGMKIEELFDQSLFVRAAVDNVIHEGLIAACLTGTMILLFLGSWRSTLIVLISIPLSILSSIIALNTLNMSLNIMTLGGLALAIGILVDDATVEIENIHRNIGMGKPLETAILDGAQQIAVPTLVATLAICIVFVPVVLLEGPARYLFVPFALAVIFAVFSSYILSRTLVPVMVKYMLAAELAAHHDLHHKKGWFARLHDAFNEQFDRLKAFYLKALRWSLDRPVAITGLAGLVVLSSFAVLPFVGRDFFPIVDAGQFRLHVKAASGLRVEHTEQIFSQVEAEIKKVIPPHEIALTLDNIGVAAETFNLAFGDSATTGTSDGEILVSLKHHRSHSTPEYMKLVREHLIRKFPNLTFYYQPADIVNQILSFGLPTPIDIRIIGYSKADNLALAKEIVQRVSLVRGAADVHLHQEIDSPQLKVDVDRTRAAKIGLTQRDVANDLLLSLSSNTAVTPNYWVDPMTGVQYFLAVQTPQYKIDSIETLMKTPLGTRGLTHEASYLGNVASLARATGYGVVNHSNIQPVLDVYANVQSRDLGGVAQDVQKIIDDLKPRLKPGSQIVMRGLVESMDTAFLRLGLGFIGAIVLVYLLMVVNFQSWTDPLIIITALPGALAGIIWMLFLTTTTFNVPSMMGAIMSVGVATANSILMVTFANEKLSEGMNSRRASMEAGATRLRPVIMTALAMIVGMIPMSLGLGEGGEQNAPLGRAVIDGLLFATSFTLFFVPVVFKVIRKNHRRPDLTELDDRSNLELDSENFAFTANEPSQN